ncbi:MAG TPA: hypothetical protein DCX39_06260 [Firmicutes bacterium]|nr:hypothetical protein [Bacillota bacterium]HAX00737.1 hypothetical protein [Bacillota bacterium]
MLGFAIFQSWGKLLVGILAALVVSLTIKTIYGKYNTVYIIDVMTDKVDEVQKLVSEEFKDTCTIYTVEGCYSKETKKIVRCVLIYKEAKLLKTIVPTIDSNAFITEYESTSVYGGSTSDAYITEKKKEKVLNKMHFNINKKEK